MTQEEYVLHIEAESAKAYAAIEAEWEATPITRAELLAKLQALKNNKDAEVSHAQADKALLDFIDDAEIRQAFMALERWYA